MQLDFEDILAGSVGRILLLILFLVSSILMGGIVGGIAWAAGRHGLDPFQMVEGMLWGPLLLINLWLIPNAFFVVSMLVYLLVNDEFSHTAWGIIVGFESLFVMLGWGLRFPSTNDTVIAWTCWAVLLVMVETGIWLHRQMRINRWAREMAELSAENAMRRAEREARATGESAEPSGSTLDSR
ncbi:MAG: hypothetical protein EOP85_13035 [Verrucomicrobiaceae bacterium]|nr:MAG: hypothetical protein EOP85_13035 [Verrucomicrobiaceae bacterium]